jgi:hypothetical protein
MSFTRLNITAFLTILSFFVLTLGYKFITIAVTQMIIFIVAFCVLLFSISIAYTIVFIGSQSRSDEKNLVNRYKHEIIIAAILIVVTFPFLTESFFCFDDWWNIGNETLLNKQAIISLARPIQILILGIFDNVSINNAYLTKWAYLPILILYAIVLFHWLYSKSQDKVLSLILSSLLSIFAPALDLLGYTATSAVLYSILFSAMSVICYEQAYTSYIQKEKWASLINLFLVFILLLTALLTYQIGAQIIFVFLSIAVYFNAKKESIIKRSFIYLLLFALTNGIYLLFVRLLNKVYLVEITGDRAQMINSIPQVIEKISFYKIILGQSIMQIIAAFTGNLFILERYHGQLISFSSRTIGNVLFCFVVSMILTAFISYWFRTRNFWGLLMLLIFIPMSYFVFLILVENGYFTYYAFAHISLLMFYYFVGVIKFSQYAWEKIKTMSLGGRKLVVGDLERGYIITPFLVICALASNYYIRDFYINYNSSLYDFVKYSLQTKIENSNLKRIHVNGLISPLNADVYSRFIIETALKDLGKNPMDYQLTFSRNSNYLGRIEEADYLRILESLSEENKQELEKMYIFDPTYRQYSLKEIPTERDQMKLQRIFIQAGVIPQSTSPDTLIIDLSWTDKAYYNHIK